MVLKEIKIIGMTCTACKQAIENHFKKIKIKVTVSLIEEKGIFEYDENKWTIDDIVNNIKIVGYKPVLTFKYQKTWQDYLETFELFTSIILTFLIMIPMLKHANLIKNVPSILENGYFQFPVAFFIQFIVGRRFYSGAWRGIKNKLLGMDVLIALSTTIAFVYSTYLFIKWGPILPEGKVFFFDVSSQVITFLLVGKIIESKIRRKATNQLNKIIAAQSTDAKLSNGKIIAINDLKIGDKIFVSKGEKIPVDGYLIDFNTVVDESSITGESIPINKKINDKVFGGAINIGNHVTIVVKEDPGSSHINQIINSVRNLQAHKAPIQRFADLISNYFVPVVILVIILTFVIWKYVLGIEIGQAMIYSIAVAVVACPCALGLATPMSIMCGASRALKEGILYNKPDVFEKFQNIDVIAFDKTGTITKGELVIKKIIGEKTNMNTFISLEIISLHPIAKAFMVKKHQILKFKIKKFTNYQEVIGAGVSGTINQDKYFIGSCEFVLKYAKITNELQQEYNKLLNNGYVVVVGAKNNQITTLFALEDEIKDTAAITIQKLQAQGIMTVMITGDNKITATNIAKELGIKQVHAQIKPMEKFKIIKDLKKAGHYVAFVGDGVNDAAALNEANLSISMGSGSDIAIVSSDITLLNSDISAINNALIISQKTLRNIKQNLAWAFIWNGTMIPIAAFGLLIPWIAAMAMSVESIVVVLNSTRLKFIKLLKN